MTAASNRVRHRESKVVDTKDETFREDSYRGIGGLGQDTEDATSRREKWYREDGFHV